MIESMFYFQQHSVNIITDGPRFLVATCFKKYGLMTQMSVVSMRLLNSLLIYRCTAVSLHAQKEMSVRNILGFSKTQERIHLGIRMNCFTVRTIIHWNNLPRGMVESSSLEFSRCDWTEF